jgi:hypothetical protein
MHIKIVENFLDKKDFETLCSLKLKKTRKDEITIYSNKIKKNNIINAECIPNKLLKRMNEKYHPIALDILKELNSKKIDLYEYSEFHVVETGAEYKFPIHDDIPNKLLSGVIYLSPEKNSGTFFYKNQQGDNKKEIEWKTNRGVFFSRLERESWHSYEGDSKSNRIVLVYNLMTSKISEVMKIEKKNYLLSCIRTFANPYLSKFFKKVI